MSSLKEPHWILQFLHLSVLMFGWMFLLSTGATAFRNFGFTTPGTLEFNDLINIFTFSGIFVFVITLFGKDTVCSNCKQKSNTYIGTASDGKILKDAALGAVKTVITGNVVGGVIKLALNVKKTKRCSHCFEIWQSQRTSHLLGGFGCVFVVFTFFMVVYAIFKGIEFF